MILGFLQQKLATFNEINALKIYEKIVCELLFCCFNSVRVFKKKKKKKKKKTFEKISMNSLPSVSGIHLRKNSCAFSAECTPSKIVHFV